MGMLGKFIKGLNPRLLKQLFDAPSHANLVCESSVSNRGTNYEHPVENLQILPRQEEPGQSDNQYGERTPDHLVQSFIDLISSRAIMRVKKLALPQELFRGRNIHMLAAS